MPWKSTLITSRPVKPSIQFEDASCFASQLFPGHDILHVCLQGEVMQNVSIGDVIFIILILGVIHGIMYLVTLSKKRKSGTEDDPGRE